MGLPMWASNPKHPRLVEVDLLKVYDVIKYAAKLCEHKDLPDETHRKIDTGLKACKEYFKDHEGVPEETFKTMAGFVMEYSKKRIQFCNSHLNNFVVHVVNEAYKVARIRSVPFSRDFPLTLKDLEDYGDYSPIIAQGLRCQFCFGHHSFNKVNHDTGVQFQWMEIARALKRTPKSKSLLPAYLWEELSVVNEDMAPGEEYVDAALVDSFLEAVEATGANQSAMVWQVVKYTDQKRRPGPKEFIRLATWNHLAAHTHYARIMFDALWRGPVYLKDRHREAAHMMAIAVAIVQCTWFSVILASTRGTELMLGFERSRYEDRQYPGPMLWERGEFPHTMVSPGARLFDPALLHGENGQAICAVDARVPNPCILTTVAERWMGDMFLFNADLYCLPPHERITPRRAEVLAVILDLSFETDDAVDWWDRWSYDLGITCLMAIRSPRLYSDGFLWKIVDIVSDPDANGRLLEEHNVARVPGRGLVSLTGLDGLFSPQTISDLENRDTIRATIQSIREFDYEGLEISLDGELVDESLVLWDNPGAAVILDAMNTRRINDNIPRTDEDEFELTANIAWTDLSFALLRATDSRTAATYTLELCDTLVQLAGLHVRQLLDAGWSRHERAGILPIDI